MLHYASVDQGTTSTRVVVLAESGEISSTERIPHQQITPHPGWVEHDAMEILQNIRTCLSQCGSVDAIGIAHQGESLLAWDAKSGIPVYNAIIWQDQRTEPEINRLKNEGMEPFVQAKSGLPLDAYFSASKMGWIIKNIPKAKQLSDRGQLRMGTMDSFFIFHLCGQHITDFNSASRTSLLNIHSLQWDQELCQLFGVPIDCLPKIQDNCSEFGQVKMADEKLVPLTACIVDQFAGLYGHGCRQPGQIKITFGTGAFLQALVGDQIPEVGTFGLLPTLCWKFSGEKASFALDGGVYNAASAINWAKKIGLFNSFTELDGFPSQPAIARGLAFVPALSGLSCPHWDRSAAGLWAGMSLETERQDLLQALLEGIAVRTLEVMQAMEAVYHLGDRIAIDGGLSANSYFNQFLADISGKEIVIPGYREMTAWGTALLARRGLGHRTEVTYTHQSTLIKPRNIDFSSWISAYKEIISRSRGLRQFSTQETVNA